MCKHALDRRFVVSVSNVQSLCCLSVRLYSICQELSNMLLLSNPEEVEESSVLQAFALPLDLADDPARLLDDDDEFEDEFEDDDDDLEDDFDDDDEEDVDDDDDFDDDDFDDDDLDDDDDEDDIDDFDDDDEF